MQRVPMSLQAGIELAAVDSPLHPPAALPNFTQALKVNFMSRCFLGLPAHTATTSHRSHTLSASSVTNIGTLRARRVALDRYVRMSRIPLFSGLHGSVIVVQHVAAWAHHGTTALTRIAASISERIKPFAANDKQPMEWTGRRRSRDQRVQPR
jgi:hypothetical protein